ncbi:MAG: 16S rRNA (guanine(527)-N(7))-methyltransferase RsmG [Candidatus Eremiobacteraeota bacterium]|nr:16S rRNA (guanine(527)-N(7))-methyltransferase RsmG [Candidatus Eremiobacteraeota bacterium]
MIASADDFAGVTGDRAIRDKLATYIERLLERNAKLNLTGARDRPSALEHVRDSLTLRDWIAAPHVDIGSGGGFPAIPLAIATGIPMTLIESTAKKATFLREIVRELELPIDVLAVRAEEAGRTPALRGTFASATARAVGPLPVVLELALPLLAVGGIAILQRGRFEAGERRATADALLVLGGDLTNEVVPDDPADERRVIFVRKMLPTNQRFPRRPGIPAKRPLCSADG